MTVDVAERQDRCVHCSPSVCSGDAARPHIRHRPPAARLSRSPRRRARKRLACILPQRTRVKLPRQISNARDSYALSTRLRSHNQFFESLRCAPTSSPAPRPLRLSPDTRGGREAEFPHGWTGSSSPRCIGAALGGTNRDRPRLVPEQAPSLCSASASLLRARLQTSRACTRYRPGASGRP